MQLARQRPDGRVQWVEVCFCSTPIEEERPYWEEYFDLELLHGRVDLTLVESGGDNLTAIFSRGLVDVQIFVIDTAGGDDVPRRVGPGWPSLTSSSSTRSIWRRTCMPTSTSCCARPRLGGTVARSCDRRW